MSRRAEDYKYLLRLPAEDEPAVTELAKQFGQSINSILVLCIRKGLPAARQALCQSGGRVTTVDPLPDSVLERIYVEKDELENITGDQLAKFQSQTEPE